MLPALSSYIYPELVEAANAALRARGFQTLLDCTGGDPEAERAILRSLKVRRPAGIIVSPWQGCPAGSDPVEDARTNLVLLRDLRSAGIAVLLLDNELGDETFNSIVLDDRAGGAAAAEFFLARGLGDAAVVWKSGHAPFLSRRDGFLERMASAGAGNSLGVDGAGAAGVAAALSAFAAAGSGLPRAFFCTNDELAFSLIEALIGRGFRVPEDIAVIGFDDSPPARVRNLSSFAYPSRWIGTRAAELMEEALSGEPTRARTRIAIESVLVERDSTRGFERSES